MVCAAVAHRASEMPGGKMTRSSELGDGEVGLSLVSTPQALCGLTELDEMTDGRREDGESVGAIHALIVG